MTVDLWSIVSEPIPSTPFTWVWVTKSWAARQLELTWQRYWRCVMGYIIVECNFQCHVQWINVFHHKNKIYLLSKTPYTCNKIVCKISLEIGFKWLNAGQKCQNIIFGHEAFSVQGRDNSLLEILPNTRNGLLQCVHTHFQWMCEDFVPTLLPLPCSVFPALWVH